MNQIGLQADSALEQNIPASTIAQGSQVEIRT